MQGAATSQELIQAYEQAKYIVNNKNGFELRVGLKSEKLDQIMKQQDVFIAAFITPENPFSKRLSKQENAQKHQSFLANLKSTNTEFVDGYGVDDAEQWPREKSYLVFVKNKAHAKQLAQAYRQNAYLLCEINQPVALAVCSTNLSMSRDQV